MSREGFINTEQQTNVTLLSRSVGSQNIILSLMVRIIKFRGGATHQPDVTNGTHNFKMVSYASKTLQYHWPSVCLIKVQGE